MYEVLRPDPTVLRPYEVARLDQVTADLKERLALLGIEVSPEIGAALLLAAEALLEAGADAATALDLSFLGVALLES